MNQYKEQIYAGLIGKAIGVRLGAPIEPYQWDYNKIQKYYGNLTGYVKDSWKFAADDDTNGPIFFVRSMIDNPTEPVTPENVSHAWLNYAREEEGMFWWGGEGVSTEHTAYNNLIKGIKAPESGSSKINSKFLSEQVGGQIFVDSWGLVNPGNIQKAMKDSRSAASVSHDGEALIGAEFIAGMIAGAFVEKDIYKLTQLVLNCLDQESEYVEVLNIIFDFYKKEPHDFRKAYDFILHHYSYDHYEGMCPVIPNACIVLVGLLYGAGDFARSVEITCMCGWDTDSNAGVVGTIVGVLVGLEGLPEHYRDPINDVVIASSMSASMNVVNLSDFAEVLYNLSKGIVKENQTIDFKFPFKGSTHGLQIRNDFRLVRDRITKSTDNMFSLLIDNLVIGDQASVYLQTSYRPSDFGDNRYDPVFSPLVYAGQKVSITVSTDIDFIDSLYVAPYIMLTDNTVVELNEYEHLKDKEIRKIEFIIPDTKGLFVREIGLNVKTESEPIDGNGLLGRLNIHSFQVDGSFEYGIYPEFLETHFLNTVYPFSNHRIKSTLESQEIIFEAKERDGISLSGNYFVQDVMLEYTLNQIDSEEVLIPFRVRGLENYYLFRINNDTLTLEKRDYLENSVLVSTKNFDLPKTFTIVLDIKGQNVDLIINDRKVISYDALNIDYGHFGIGCKNGRVGVKSIKVKTF